MSNHARGLWGYSGRTPAGAELTIQATGMGGPSAAVVLADLAELGVRAGDSGRHLFGARSEARARGGAGGPRGTGLGGGTNERRRESSPTPS